MPATIQFKNTHAKRIKKPLAFGLTVQKTNYGVISSYLVMC